MQVDDPPWQSHPCYLLLALQVLIVLSAALHASAQHEVAVFGPETFFRSTGKPQLETRTFSPPSGVQPPFKVLVDNGNLDGTNRVSSARILLNGVEIVRPSDLNQNVSNIEREVTLQQENTLEVELRSAPESFLTVGVTGQVPVPFIDFLSVRMLASRGENLQDSLASM